MWDSTSTRALRDLLSNIAVCAQFSRAREKCSLGFVSTALKKRSLMSITNHGERRFFGAIERGESSFEAYRAGKIAGQGKNTVQPLPVTRRGGAALEAFLENALYRRRFSQTKVKY